MPQTILKYLSLKHLLISKITNVEKIDLAIQKINFLGIFEGAPRDEGYPQTMSKYLTVEYLLI